MSQEYDFSKGKRGAIAPLPMGKTRITIRLDDEVLHWFRARVHQAGGGNYQSLINSALREHVLKRAEPLEETLRRVLREEFHAKPTRLQRRRSSGSVKTLTSRRKVPSR